MREKVEKCEMKIDGEEKGEESKKRKDENWKVRKFKNKLNIKKRKRRRNLREKVEVWIKDWKRIESVGMIEKVIKRNKKENRMEEKKKRKVGICMVNIVVES